MDITELKTANILLERGVKVPITAPRFFYLAGIRKKVTTLKAPSLDTLELIAVAWLEHFGEEVFETIGIKKAFEVMAMGAVPMSQMVAMALLDTGTFTWRHRLTARWLRRGLPAIELMNLYKLIILYGGLEDFTNTIRFIGMTRITKPRNLSENLSPDEAGS